MKWNNLKGKRLLILGGMRFSCEIVNKAKEMGIYTLVADYNKIEDSPAKQIADEAVDLSVTDVEAVVDFISNNAVDGVFVGFNDMLLPYYAEICKNGDGNRTINLNEELTGYHREVLSNLNSIQGALLRMNRSIQAEGTFGVIKYDRDYDRIVRRGLKSVKLEILLISIGFNLYKYHNKKHRMQESA